MRAAQHENQNSPKELEQKHKAGERENHLIQLSLEKCH